MNGTSGLLVIDMRSSTVGTVGSRASLFAPLHTAAGEALQVSVFVDHSIVEVFVNSRVVVTARSYPTLGASECVALWSAGAASAVSADVWALEL
jgi:sucrose-6-phosphate hydrolase SacC (GH32 family)